MSASTRSHHPRVASSTVELAPESVLAVTGPGDANLRVIEDHIDVEVLARGHRITVRGEVSQVSMARRVFSELQATAARGVQVDAEMTRRVVELNQRSAQKPAAVAETRSTSVGEATPPAAVAEATAPPAAAPRAAVGDAIVSYRGREVRPKTPGQLDYVGAMETNSVVFGIGPAGTGKTYLAVAKAVQALQRKEVHRVILTRPAVEAGEKLGFLPGGLDEKIDPYLRPLFDSMREMIDPDVLLRLLEAKVIEVAPLAFMRGRTLNDSFIILDEAQNTTPAQMKMVLTRLGFGSRMIITGDLSQVDLPAGTESGLSVAEKVLTDVDGVHVTYLDATDVVRHRLVSTIVDAYDRYEAEAQGAPGAAAVVSKRPAPEQPEPQVYTWDEVIAESSTKDVAFDRKAVAGKKNELAEKALAEVKKELKEAKAEAKAAKAEAEALRAEAKAARSAASKSNKAEQQLAAVKAEAAAAKAEAKAAHTAKNQAEAKAKKAEAKVLKAQAAMKKAHTAMQKAESRAKKAEAAIERKDAADER